jgi:hypothetical protein
MIHIYLSAILSFFSAGLGMSEDISAEQIVARSWDLYRQADSEKERILITVEYRDGRKYEKDLIRWTQYAFSGEDKIAAKFLRPPIDQGLGLLIWRHADREDDVWLKLPSMNQERRVSMSDQTKYFAETDFTYEDTRQLAGERIRNFSYRLLEQRAGVYVIEAVPKAGVETAYGRRIFEIRSDGAVTKAEYFGKNGMLIKRQANTEVNVQPDGLWRTSQILMENLLLGRKSLMKITERKINTELPAETFSRKFLTNSK